MARFEGKVALVTGGANGMGLECATQLAGEGAAVVLADLIADAGEAAAAAIVAAGGRARFVETNLLDRDECRRSVQTAIDEFGRLDIAVLAAGIPTSRYRSGGPDPRVPGTDPLDAFLAAPAEDWEEVLGVNLRGGYWLLQAAVAEMLAVGGGSIVVITSVAAANQTHSGGIPYSASKAGAWAMVKHLARLTAGKGIRVNAVGPGLIETNMSRGYLADANAKAAVLTAIPIGRAGTVTDIANAVLFLASDDASFITGEALYVDGGQFTG
jgi:NAD(P)-dependent dehydrogenase (short-subunit alcohol dehydrogenase family)